MLKLEDIQKDAQIRGLEGDKIVRIVHAETVGSESVNVFYVVQEGKPGTQSLFCADESRLELATAARPVSRRGRNSNWAWKPTGYTSPICLIR